MQLEKFVISQLDKLNSIQGGSAIVTTGTSDSVIGQSDTFELTVDTK